MYRSEDVYLRFFAFQLTPIFATISEELPNTTPSTSQFILYTAPQGDIKLEVFVQDETLWLTQKMMAELFGVNVSTISEHLQNIFQSAELEEDSVIRKFRTTAGDGKQYLTNFYNLDAIIAVGYRVNSHRATQFRIWATQTLKEFILKGFVLNDDRLKQGRQVFSKDYFRELLDRVRSIRASERRIYQQITDIFAECSIDYDPKSKITTDFFATSVSKFLEFNEYKILDGKGSVSKKQAENKALTEYKAFNKTQPIESDFDRMVKSITVNEDLKSDHD